MGARLDCMKRLAMVSVPPATIVSAARRPMLLQRVAATTASQMQPTCTARSAPRLRFPFPLGTGRPEDRLEACRCERRKKCVNRDRTVTRVFNRCVPPADSGPRTGCPAARAVGRASRGSCAKPAASQMRPKSAQQGTTAAGTAPPWRVQRAGTTTSKA